jgi:D-amino-acid dehydrogenase
MISLPGGLLSVGSTGGRDYDRQELFLGLDFDRRPTEPAKLELLKRAVEVLPDVAGSRLVRQLAGSRPLSADRMPIIGPVPGWEGVILATGHGTKGVHLGPFTGRVIADYVLRGKTDVPVDMDGFLPQRFASGQSHDYWAASQKVEE